MNLALVCPDLIRFPAATSFMWVQEEPLNAGAWAFVAPHIQRALRVVGRDSTRLQYVGRPSLPTPAQGLSKDNQAQWEVIVKAVKDGLSA